MMQVISDPEKIDRIEWSYFVKNNPHGNIFQTPEIYEVYKKTKNYEPIFLAIVDSNNKIQILLLAVIQREYSGILGKFTGRSIIFGGPLLCHNDPFLLDTLLKEYNTHINNKSIYSQFRNFTKQDDCLDEVFKKNGFSFENHLNILLDLKIGVDELWKGIKKNRRDGINKGRKQGFVFKVKNKLDSVDKFFELFKELYANIRIPYPDKSFFHNLNEIVYENLMWFILEFNGEPFIVLCAFQFNKVLYAFSVGICQDKDFQKLRPVDYFYWEVIKWGSENGLDIFDWMGAGNPKEEYGVRKFKLQYGGELMDLGRYIKVHNTLLFNIGKNGIKIRKKLKI